MVNVFSSNKKKDEHNEDGKQPVQQEAPPTQSTEQPVDILQKMKMEEAQLAEQKRNLVQLKEQLQTKIKDKIEARKSYLQKLKTEVDQLKAECIGLNETLEAEVVAAQ